MRGRYTRAITILALAAIILVSPARILAGNVGTSDLIDGAITTPKIAAGAVTGVKIAAGAVGPSQLADGAVSGSKISAGAINDAHIAGPISVVKLPVGSTANTVAAGNHLHEGVYAKKSANVVVVAKSGGEFSDLGAAINSISDASAENPYLVKLMPGVYNILETIEAKSYVFIEGSGPDVTILHNGTDQNVGPVARFLGSGLISGLSNLTVNSDGGFGGEQLIVGTDATRISLRNVNIDTPGTTYGSGQKIYFQNIENIVIDNVNIIAEDGIMVSIIGDSNAIINKFSATFSNGIGLSALGNVNIIITDSTIIGGLTLADIWGNNGEYSPIIRMNNCRLIVNNSGYNIKLNGQMSKAYVNNSEISRGLILNDAGKINVANSQLIEVAVGDVNEGTTKLFNVFDENYLPR